MMDRREKVMVAARNQKVKKTPANFVYGFTLEHSSFAKAINFSLKIKSYSLVLCLANYRLFKHIVGPAHLRLRKVSSSELSGCVGEFGAPPLIETNSKIVFLSYVSYIKNHWTTFFNAHVKPGCIWL